MNIRCAFLERVGHNRVDELYDRSLVDERRAVVSVFGLALEDLDIVVRDLGKQALHLRFARLIELLDRVAQSELASDDREDVQTRDELDVVEHRHGCGVRHRDGKRAAVALQREHAVLQRKLGGNELGDARIDLELRQVDGRHLVLAREHSGEVGLLYETELDQIVADARAVVSLLSESGVQLVLCDQPFSQKQIADSRRFCGRSCQGRMSLR